MSSTDLFEKPRGTRRDHSQHHKGKEHLYEQVKNLRYLEKTVEGEELLSKTALKKLKKCNSQSDLNFNFDVFYSLDKKNRWKSLENLEIQEKPNCYPKNRTCAFNSKATVSYNIYKTPRNPEIVGKFLFGKKISGRRRKLRKNRRFLEDFSDTDNEESEEESEKEKEEKEESKISKILNFGDFLDFPKIKNPQNSSSNQEKDIRIINKTKKYQNIFDITGYLKSEGFTFLNFDVEFKNFGNRRNFPEQIDFLREKTSMVIKDLRENQYLIDASNWCQLNQSVKSRDGEVTTVVGVTHLEGNFYNILINSTIPQHPGKKETEFWRKIISNYATLMDVIRRITKELLIWRKIVHSLQNSAHFYAQKSFQTLLNDPDEWENAMINMQWPHQNHKEHWTCSVSKIGKKLEWSQILEQVRSKEPGMVTVLISGNPEKCAFCHKKKKNHELFSIKNDEEKGKCADCLRDQFYCSLSRSTKKSINLETETADELEYLPVIMPIGVVNFYVRKLAEQLYNHPLEKCASCESTLIFETEEIISNSNKNSNKSCPCGYCWCKKCKGAPHWPMNCEEYQEFFEGKWKWRYTMLHSQGSGAHQLLQITCQCSESIFHVLLPSDSAHCPSCKVFVNLKTMRTIIKHSYYPYDPMLRHLLKQGFCDEIGKDYDKSNYLPRGKIYLDIKKIPKIPKEIIEICGAARDARFNSKFHEKIVNRAHFLGFQEEVEEIEKLSGAAAYLSENVMAFLYVRNILNSKTNLKKMLEELMEKRIELGKLLEAENSKKLEFEEHCKKMRILISNVMNTVSNIFNDK